MPSKGCILVTGANGGLGSAIVKHIREDPVMASDYTGLYAVRNVAAASRLQSVLDHSTTPHRHETLELDMSSLESVRHTAADINRRVAEKQLPPIRALILNAAFLELVTLTMSDDGFEMAWQVNFLANFVFALLLLQSMDMDADRILIISSWSHDIEDARNAIPGAAAYKQPKWESLFLGTEAHAKGRWSTPQEDASETSGYRRYGASKLCVVMLMHELGCRLARDPRLSRVAVVGLDPGGMSTDIVRRGGLTLRLVVMKIVIPLLAAVMVRVSANGIARPPWKSAADAMSACFEVVPSKGKALYLDGSDEGQTAEEAQDEGKRKALWAYGLEAAGIKAGDTILRDWR